MRRFGILSEGGDCLYLYSTMDQLIEGTLKERLLEADEELVKITGYTILASGPGEEYGDAKTDD